MPAQAENKREAGDLRRHRAHHDVIVMITYERLQFDEHSSDVSCRATMQLSSLERTSKYLDSKSKDIFYNIFVANNFNCCPLVRYFCGQRSNYKQEKVHECSLRIIYNDYEYFFQSLLKCSKQDSLLTRRLKIVILEVFKTVNKLNANSIHNLFT